MNNLRTIAIAILITITTVCASSYNIPLTQEFIDSKQPVNLASTVVQKEIDARMPVSYSGGAVGVQFGFVGMLIDFDFSPQLLASADYL